MVPRECEIPSKYSDIALRDCPTGWYSIFQCQRIRRNFRETWIATTRSADTTSMVDYQPVVAGLEICSWLQRVNFDSSSWEDPPAARQTRCKVSLINFMIISIRKIQLQWQWKIYILFITQTTIIIIALFILGINLNQIVHNANINTRQMTLH